MATTQVLACTPLPGTHSNDRICLQYGAPDTAVICGRHAATLDAEDYRIMHDAGTY